MSEAISDRLYRIVLFGWLTIDCKIMFTHNLQYVSHQILIKSNLLAIPNLFFVTMILFEPDAFKCFNIRLSVINCKLRQCHVKQWKPWFSHAMPLSTTVSFSPYFWC